MGKIQSMLTLDGEADFRRQLNLINANLKTLDKELAATSSQFAVGAQKMKQSADISANYSKQVEFLKSKQDVLQRAMANAQKEIDNNNKKLSDARQAYDLNQKAIDKTKKEIEYLTAKYGANSKEVQHAKERLDMYQTAQKNAAKEISVAETAITKAGKAYHSYRQQLADTETQLNKVTEAQRKQAESAEKTVSGINVDLTGLVATGNAVLATIGVVTTVVEKVGSVAGKVANAGIQTLNTSFKAVNGELELGIKGIEAYVGAVAAAGTALGGFSVSNGMSFEASMSKVQAYANLDPVKDAEAIRALTEAAKATGASTTKTATEAADALGYLALNGWKTEQMLNALLPVTKASEAGGIDLATVANLTARSLTAYGKGAEEAEDFLNILTAAQNNSSNSLYDLLTVYTDTAGTFKELGVDFKESAALIGVFANQGVSGAEAATALNSVMLRLLGTNKKAKTALTDIGVSAWNEDGTFKGLTQTLREAGEALADMTQEERINAEAAISGVLRFQDFQKLINGVMDTEGYQNVWDPIASAIDNQTLYQTSETMMNNLQGKVELLKSATSALGTSIYESFSGKATTGVLDLTHWVDLLNQGVKDASLNYEKLDRMQADFDAGKIYSGFNEVSDLISPSLAAALRSEGTLMDELMKRADEPVIRSIRAVSSRASSELSKGITGISKELPGKLRIFNFSIEEGAKLLVQGIHESKELLLPEIIEGATNLALELTDYLPQLVDDLAGGAEMLFNGIINGLDKVVDKLEEDGKLDSIIETVNGFFDRNGVQLWEAGLKILGKIGEGILKHKDKLMGTGLKIINGISDDITKYFPKLMDKASEIVGKIVEKIKEEETLEKLTGAGTAVVNSLIKFIDQNSYRFGDIIDIISRELKTEENQDRLMDMGMYLGDILVRGVGVSLAKLTPLGSLIDAGSKLGEEWNKYVTPIISGNADAGTTVEPAAKTKSSGSSSGDNVTFNITGNNINDYNDIERLVEQGAVLYNNAMKAGGKR